MMTSCITLTLTDGFSCYLAFISLVLFVSSQAAHPTGFTDQNTINRHKNRNRCYTTTQHGACCTSVFSNRVRRHQTDLNRSPGLMKRSVTTLTLLNSSASFVSFGLFVVCLCLFVCIQLVIERQKEVLRNRLKQL